jgi:hypothetical protein
MGTENGGTDRTLTREEYLEQAKKLALEDLDAGDAVGAVITMMRELAKHPETRKLTEGTLRALGLVAAAEADRGNFRFARDYITGFH